MKRRFSTIVHHSCLGIFFTVLIPGAPVYAQARPPYVGFETNAGKPHIALADLAYADSVISFRQGSPGADGMFAQAQSACGAADGKPELTDIHTVSLGCGGILDLRLSQPLIDSAGHDLVIFENGKFRESVEIFVSSDHNHWIHVGSAGGGISEIDIERSVRKGGSFRFIRLADRRENCSGPFAGADIDAVGVVIRQPPSQGSAVFFSIGSHKLSRPACQTIDSMLYNVGDVSGQTMIIRGGTDRSGSDLYNRELARRRGDAVIRYIRNRLGDTTIELRNEPLDPITRGAEIDRAQQRRAQILIVP
jgi:OmpA-OmpF porin, OOP family